MSQLNDLIEANQRLEAQLQENIFVQKELDEIDAESQVYKLIGPALIKQDLDEARANVGKRLEFIKEQLNNLQPKIEECKLAQTPKGA